MVRANEVTYMVRPNAASCRSRCKSTLSITLHASNPPERILLAYLCQIGSQRGYERTSMRLLASLGYLTQCATFSNLLISKQYVEHLFC